MINIIVAISKNRVIGKDNTIPWHISEDLKHFKKLTKNHPVIMGRKTFESMGKPLKKRTNVVVTSNKELSDLKIKLASDISSAIEIAKDSQGSDEIFIIGGARIFEESLEIVDRLYLTFIDKEIDGDIHFPEINLNEWNLVDEKENETQIDGEPVKYYFREYLKNSK